MEVVKTLQEITKTLDELDTYYDGLTNELSEIDLKIQDLLHYIENHKISILWAYKYVVELKKLRLERRRIKNDMFILGKYSEHKNKIIAGFTSKYNLTKLVYYEVFDSEIGAIQREKVLKHYNRNWKKDLIESINPNWSDLYSKICQ